MQTESLGLNLEISKAINDNISSIEPMVVDILVNVAENITAAKDLSDDLESQDEIFENALEDIEKSKFMPGKEYEAVKFLQNITDDLCDAKSSVDKNGDEAVSKLL